jgi:hypothetical protein
VTSEIEELERAGWDALSGPDGAAFYAECMADDGLMVFPGSVMDKAAAIAAISSAAPWSSYELSDVRIVEAAPGSTVIAYRASAVRGTTEYVAEMTSHYARRNDRWQLILHQQSPG